MALACRMPFWNLLLQMVNIRESFPGVSFLLLSIWLTEKKNKNKNLFVAVTQQGIFHPKQPKSYIITLNRKQSYLGSVSQTYLQAVIGTQFLPQYAFSCFFSFSLFFLCNFVPWFYTGRISSLLVFYKISVASELKIQIKRKKEFANMLLMSTAKLGIGRQPSLAIQNNFYSNWLLSHIFEGCNLSRVLYNWKFMLLIKER